MPGKCFHEFLVVQPITDLFGDEVAQIFVSLIDVGIELRARVDDGDEVLHVVVEEVSLAPPEERLDLRSAEVRSIYDADGAISTFDLHRVIPCTGVPDISQPYH